MSGLNERMCEELANVPMARPGYDALNMSGPLLVQMNPEGKWENTKPASLDENRLRAVVQQLLSSNALSATQSYCHQCAALAKRDCGQSRYVPVIMMPVYSANDCPYDMNSQIEKNKDGETKPTQKKKVHETNGTDAEKVKKKTKKRGWTLQRLTDFDLLSQW